MTRINYFLIGEVYHFLVYIFPIFLRKEEKEYDYNKQDNRHSL